MSRPKRGEERPITAAQCERAWGIMSRGVSLHRAASLMGVAMDRLDRAIWVWRDRVCRG